LPFTAPGLAMVGRVLILSLEEERDMEDDPSTDLTGFICIGNYAQIKYWCAQFGCTEVELAEAIAAVGYSRESVREFLAKPTPRAA